MTDSRHFLLNALMICASFVLAAVSAAATQDTLVLSIDKAIPLALIINELVTNAMKHAFADGRTGEIRIGLQEYRDRSRPVPTDLGRAYTFELTVADNGVGLPAGFDAKNQKSLGLQLVGMLTQQLAGQFAMESTAGTAVHILFDQNEKTQEQS